MTWFTRPLPESTTVPRGNPSSSLEAELELVSQLYVQAEQQFSEACLGVAHHKRGADAVHIVGTKALVHLNEMNRDPLFAQKCNARAQALRRRNELLSRRAELRKQLGLTR